MKSLSNQQLMDLQYPGADYLVLIRKLLCESISEIVFMTQGHLQGLRLWWPQWYVFHFTFHLLLFCLNRLWHISLQCKHSYCSCPGFALVFELRVPFRFLFQVLQAHSNIGLCPSLIENSKEYDQITTNELWNLKLCEHVFNLSCFNRSHKVLF